MRAYSNNIGASLEDENQAKFYFIKRKAVFLMPKENGQWHILRVEMPTRSIAA
jgi:hypothetical protein